MADTDWSQFTPVEDDGAAGQTDWSQFEPIETPKPKARNAFAVANDLVIEAANAAASGVGAITDFVLPGNTFSKNVDAFVKSGEASQSDVAKAAKQRLQTGLSEAPDWKAEVGTVVDYVLSNPALALAQGLGSFAGPGLAAAGVSAGAKAAGLGAKAAGRVGLAGSAAVSGAMAGGDAAGSAYDMIKQADEAQLAQGAAWQELAAEGKLPDEIREELAQRAARTASLIPALIGGVTGAVGAERLVAGLGKGGGRLATGARSMLSEGIQEGVEEGATQYEAGRAAQAYDPSIDPSKGVAGAATLGAALGAGTGGAIGVLATPSPRRKELERQLAEGQTVDEITQAALELSQMEPEIDTALAAYQAAAPAAETAAPVAETATPTPEYADLTPMTRLQAQQRLAVLRDQSTDSGIEYAVTKHPSSENAFAIEQARLPQYEIGSQQVEQEGPPTPGTADRPTAPPAREIIAALRTEPFQRDATQKTVLNTAAARLSPEDQALVQKAADGPFALTIEERNRLIELNDGAKLSPQRVLEREAARVGGTARIVDVASLPSAKDVQRTADGLEQLSREVHGLVERIGRVFKKEIVLFDSDKLNVDGFVNPAEPDRIFLNVKAQKPHLVLLGHEITHQMKAQLGHAYTAFEQVVRSGVDEAGLARHKAEYGENADIEELSADLMGNRFAEPEFWTDVFAQVDKNLGSKAAVGVVQRLGALINRAVQIAKRAIYNASVFQADDYITNLNDVKAAAKKALAQYAVARRNAPDTQPGQDQTQDGQAKASPSRTENNASGESAASLEAQGRLRQERERGRQRVLVEKDGTVRLLPTVDAVDQRARAGQVILQRGVGAGDWTVLDAGPGSNKAAALAKAQAWARASLGGRRDDLRDAQNDYDSGFLMSKFSTRRDKQGAEYDVEVREEFLGADKKERAVIVEAKQNGNRRGLVDFAVRNDGVLVAENAKVAPMLKGRGIAEMMYRAVRDAGYDIAPGRVQTDEGQRMVESLQRKGVINKEAEGKRFRAGDLDLVPIEGESIPGEKVTRASARRAETLPDIGTENRAALTRIASNLTVDERAKLRVGTAERLVEIVSQLPRAPEIAAVAFAGRAKRGWYKESARAIANVFGPDAPRFAGLLAAMSPQTSVENNLINTLNTWKNWLAAGRPTDPREIRRVMGRSVQGNKGEGSVLEAWVNNSIRALTSEGRIRLSGPKVSSFMHNLLGNVEEVTNDAWMANFALVNQTMFSGSLLKTGDPGKGPGYLAMSSQVRAAARELTKRTGDVWTPAEVQETVWSWAKTLYEAQKDGVTATALLYNEEITDDMIRATPDFRTLFHDRANDRALRAAGYGEQLDQLATERPGEDAERGDAGQTAPFDSESQARHEIRAAKRLEKLKEEGTAAFAKFSTRRQPITVTGIHYSQEPRTVLSGTMHGTGLKGAERQRGAGPRIHFYLDTGNGVKPEAGVGGYAHRATLENLYDLVMDPNNLVQDSKGLADFEKRVVDAGYDGYFDVNFRKDEGAAVLLGDRTIKVERAGQGELPPSGEPVPRATREPETGFRAVVAQLNAAKGLPSGALTPARWLEVLPAELGQPLRDAGVLEGTEPLYKNELVQAYKWAAVRGAKDTGGSAPAFAPAEKVAEEYLRSVGLPVVKTPFEPLIVERSERVARAYDDLVSNPADPEVKAAYKALATETVAQYKAMLSTGLKLEFIRGRDPYAGGLFKALEDIRNNNHLFVFSTRDGFGSTTDLDPAEHPMLAETEFKISGETALVNDLFRAVHDYFGHLRNGFDFTAAGEENAWRSHDTMFSRAAAPALATETIGQSSWVNYGPEGSRNRAAEFHEVKFADQKAALMPEAILLELRQTGNSTPTLNIGLSTVEVKGSGENNLSAVTAAIQKIVPVLGVAVHQSDTELTAVVSIGRPLTAAEGLDLSVALSQEAIAQRMPDGTGDLFGPNAAAWGPYNPEYFVMPDGTRADAVKASPRRQVVGDSGRKYTSAQKAMFQRVGRTVETPTLQERIVSLRKDLGKRMAQGIVDQFRPVRDIDKNAYTLLRLSKGAAGAVEAFLHHGKLKVDADGVYDADTSGGFIERVATPLRGELEDFLWWIAANRAERLAAEDRENLFSAEDIAAGKSLINGTTAHDYTLRDGRVTRDRSLIFPDALKTFDEFNKNAMDVAEQSGLIDPESRKFWEHEFYVPFYRVSDDDSGFVGANIKSGVVRQSAFKQLKGGTDKLNSDLLANTLQNWAHLIDASAKNRAARATLEAAARLGGAVEADATTIRQLGRSAGLRKNAVWFMDGGKERHFLVEDKALLAALSGLEFAGLRGPLMHALSSLKHWLTIGVTISPAFKIRNLIRDTVQAVAVSPLSYNIAENVREGFAASRRGTQPYVSALASGGLIRFGTMLEGSHSERVRQLVQMGIDESTILDSADKLAHMRHLAEKAFMAYSELGNRGEEINRSALFQQLQRKGFSRADAALAARDLMDFSMQGAWTSVRFLTQTVPFMNARLQGLYKLGRAAGEDPKRFAIVAAAAGLVSLLLMSIYHDDDDWKKREDWDRDNYWWFKVGGVAYRIPKPFEIGAIATLAERGVELLSDDEMTGKRFLKRVRDLATDQLSMNPVSQAVKPILDIYANKDSFTGRPIETLGMERLRPDYRYTARTSMPARAISSAGQTAAEAVGGNFLSPVQVDHLVRGYLGWLGSFAVGSADMVIRPFTDEPTRPAADMYKLATLGFVSELPEPGSRYVTQLYEQAKELDQAYATWRNLQKTGRADEAREYLDANRESIRKSKTFGAVKQEEARINERIRIIERSDKDPAAKREEIQRLQAQKDRLARRLAAREAD